jgi:dolichol-phosphate mannosyltransferase
MDANTPGAASRIEVSPAVEAARAAVTLGIVCPMANEEACAERFVREVLCQCGGFKSVQMFVVLDGATSDNTRGILDALASAEPRLRVVWAPENRCVVDAYVRGYREALNAGCDWILEIDAGFSHSPDDMPRFFAKIGRGYDCIFGTRFAGGGRIQDSSLTRRIVSRGGTLLANLLLRTRLSDMTSGFQLFSRRALQMVLERGIASRAHFFQTEIKFYCSNLSIVEVPITYKAASPRLSSSSLSEAFRQLWRLYRSRNNRGAA